MTIAVTEKGEQTMSRYIDADEIKESILDKWGVDPKYLDDSLEASKKQMIEERLRQNERSE